MVTGEVVDAIVLPDGSPFPHGASVWKGYIYWVEESGRGARADLPREDLAAPLHASRRRRHPKVLGSTRIEPSPTFTRRNPQAAEMVIPTTTFTIASGRTGVSPLVTKYLQLWSGSGEKRSAISP
jgi:hypothetical protein